MSDSRTFEVRYEAGHSYVERWVPARSVNFCSNCGADRSVWVEDSEGDYYLGPEYLCVACGAGGYGVEMEVGRNWQDRQRLAALRREGSPARDEA